MTKSGPPPRGPASPAEPDLPRPASGSASIWIGSYGGGLCQLRCDAGHWSLGIRFADAGSASFGTYSPRHDLHYIVDERDAGTVGVYRASIAEHGDTPSWTTVARAATRGDAPCHIALDHSQTRLAVANYSTGSVSVFVLNEAGLPTTPAQLFVHDGSGPNAERQASPHAH